ncbi:hypothetical protein [Sulfurimonas sp.]|uniref:hypothetical protein n=1 Tax=Sulfurimonas sp. TaxID=2022749 RepID=UPI0025F1F5E0|nr:hypothetical protein [Sulfurimonas sp.]
MLAPCEGGKCTKKDNCRRYTELKSSFKFKSKICIAFGHDLYKPKKKSKTNVTGMRKVKMMRRSYANV